MEENQQQYVMPEVVYIVEESPDESVYEVDDPMEIGGDSLEVAGECKVDGGDVFEVEDEVIEIVDDSDDDDVEIVVEAEEGVDAANDGGVEEDMSEEWLDEDLWKIEAELLAGRKQRKGKGKAKKPKEVCKDVITDWLAMRDAKSGSLESLLRIWINVEDVFIHRLNQCKCHTTKK